MALEDEGSYLSSPFILTLISTLFVLALSLFVRRVQVGYHAFLALGPGGTPSTFAGYLRICVLRIFALRNPLHPPFLSPNLPSQTGILKNLPKRAGPRPKVVGIAPQRQMTQRGTPAMYAALTAAIKEISAQNIDGLYLGTSCFEKHSTGLFSTPSLRSQPTCNGEVCHSHPSDGSLHLTLHPADVKHIIEKGWGERHPLARESWWWKLRFVPVGFVMIYAPQTMEELQSVIQIIHAAAWWVTGTEPRSQQASLKVLGQVPCESVDSQTAANSGVKVTWCDTAGCSMGAI
ncbi:hypothetical protein LOZ12_004485 [Ophidiomyces ophidiicola]|uniref:Uncharacterized protein n=1 Tax=Ophidiomyces ophidiicola TaxID=1387563 RepID=A0ACB8V006_9EURO|nr:uncharacterized protein LOZ57_000156 [Ophidiomyces ophidiicola]KAI1910551.1 hypothetical protein LOZ64_004931 [Ophidiomyces ophidiicola]KAI1953815.1 hypothetical protein LOZ57_000156 [Ophidiomyces ophidiicola]KAI1954775.1 hypothetical protein LOZ62_000552 [Ophidiomyces ophidiicola]KAI1970047.1 hypothetical protein LOZ56_003968 [Ophidiomyces ophidiicola]KAI1972573.1 hypothetical protein LOZ55_005743 [Ophidiomyces ophidiicola]